MTTTAHVLFLTAAALLICAACAQAATTPTRCPDCGSTPVPYPLSTAPSCGHPHYAVLCNAGKLSFPSLDTTYPIKAIDAGSQVMLIQPPSLLPGTCLSSDLVYGGLNLNESLPFNLTSSTTVMLLNCTENLLESPLNCTAASQCHAYIGGTAAGSACRNSPICCTFRVGPTASHRILIRGRGCSAYSAFVNLNPGAPVAQWPEPGLQVQWELPQ